MGNCFFCKKTTTKFAASAFPSLEYLRDSACPSLEDLISVQSTETTNYNHGKSDIRYKKCIDYDQDQDYYTFLRRQ